VGSWKRTSSSGTPGSLSGGPPHAAVRAVKRRYLAVDSGLVRAARDLPMTERRGPTFPHAHRVHALADQILAAR
jgi:hypothetical protein